MRKTILGLALATLGYFAGTAGAAPERTPEDASRVINISTHGGTVTQRLVLGLNKAAIVQLDTDARDVLVSSPEVVDAVVRTPRRIFLLALKTGQTNAFFFDGAGHQLASIDIRVEKDVTDLSAMMRSNLPGSNIKVSAINDNVVLSGSVSSAQESARAQDLAARFAGDPNKVVNMLKVPGSEQVMIRVRIAEMQRNIAKQFGIDLTAAATVGGVPLMMSTANPYSLLGRALSDLSGAQAGFACSHLGTASQRGSGTVRRASQQSAGHRQGAGAGRPGAHPGRAESHRGLRRNGEVPRRRRVPGSGQPRPRRQRHGSVQAVRRRSFLHAGRAQRGPHFAAGVHRSQRTDQHGRLHGQHDIVDGLLGQYDHGRRSHHSGAVGAPRRDHGRSARRAAASPSPA